jgi:2-polyprenyl-3-methyl-5-hydroxy-6-metoxy-1,4-benzoquinol methylase
MSSDKVRDHYVRYPYPRYPLLSTVRQCDTYALNLQALWARFNGVYQEADDGRILIAGSGSFAPYPMSVANPEAKITALDLSSANLKRARLHCLLHGRRNVNFIQGDILNDAIAPGPFHFIDSFGVIHHLENPLDGLKALERRLAPGGILRLMVYGRYARKEAESIRRAMKILRIKDIQGLKRLLGKTIKGSRVREYLDASWEARSDSGLADLFLNPQVHTYRIDEFLKLVGQTRLKPLLFAHRGALPDPAAEIEKLRDLDRRRETPINIICYLGLDTRGPCPIDADTMIRINSCLSRAVSLFRLSPLIIPPRLGSDNPILDLKTRRFLKRFSKTVPAETLSAEEMETTRLHLATLFLTASKD